MKTSALLPGPILLPLMLFCLVVSEASVPQLDTGEYLTYLLIDQTNNTIDTVYRRTTIQVTGSSEGIVCYELKSSSATTNECYVISQEVTGQSTRLIDSKRFYFEGEAIDVAKYRYDDPNVEDEEISYFYAQGVGLLLIKSEAWPGYERLLDVPQHKENALIFYLIESIINYQSFFN